MVKVCNHASKHANDPNPSTCSNCGGNNKKFKRRSNLILDDSYGYSLSADR
jgi:hypothetical protein